MSQKQSKSKSSGAPKQRGLSPSPALGDTHQNSDNDAHPRNEAKTASKSDVKDIWTQIKEIKEKEEKEDKKKTREPNIIFIGPRGSGKSTLVKSYMGKDDGKDKPTTALDYNFVKSSSIGQEVIHLWELGGGRTLAKLLEIPLTAERMLNAFVVLVLDMSKPECIADDATYWMKVFKDQISVHVRMIESKKLAHAQKMREKAKSKFGDRHPDGSRVDLSIVPILIVAHKWDVFLSKYNNNPNQLRMMSRMLRAFAHFHGASLSYCSSVAPHKGLLQAFRFRVARHLTNRPDAQQTNITDHTKPICIQAPGTDSWADIETTGSGTPLEGWITACKQAFPPNREVDVSFYLTHSIYTRFLFILNLSSL
jgi:dynein light intermediate chain 2